MKLSAIVCVVAACAGSPKAVAPGPAPTAAPTPAPVAIDPAPVPPAPLPTPAPPAPSPGELAAQGKVVMDKFGCLACHTVDGSTKIGPTLKSYFGMKLVEDNGAQVVGSEERFRKALSHAPALRGYAPTMPTYDGMITTAEADLLIAYLRSL